MRVIGARTTRWDRFSGPVGEVYGVARGLEAGVGDVEPILRFCLVKDGRILVVEKGMVWKSITGSRSSNKRLSRIPVVEFRLLRLLRNIKINLG
jgi:hypothetical protein